VQLRDYIAKLAGFLGSGVTTLCICNSVTPVTTFRLCLSNGLCRCFSLLYCILVWPWDVFFLIQDCRFDTGVFFWLFDQHWFMNFFFPFILCIRICMVNRFSIFVSRSCEL